MVPVEMGALKHNIGNDTEDCKGDTFLDDLQLNQVEGTAIIYKSQTIGRDLATILKEGNAPGEGDNTY
jgi:hypothetical protein